MRAILLLLLLIGLYLPGFSQELDSTDYKPDTVVVHRRPPPTAAQLLLDSVANAQKMRSVYIADSIAKQYIKAPNPNRPNKFVDLMLKTQVYHGNFMQMPSSQRSILREGHYRRKRDPQIIIIIIALITYSALLNRAVSKDIFNVMQAFYDKRILSQLSKEDALLSSWSFVGMFLLFGLTFGLFLYQVSAFYEIFYAISGIRLFLFLTLLIIILFAVKLLILRFIGFVFNIGKVVGEYITTLYLTYFNIAFVFLPVSVCFSLLAAKYIPYMLTVALLIAAIIFIWQYLRSSISIISNFQFPKFYLFIYLCALEICPILILLKALNIRT
ncbi:DUF4271 domain-containing protein [Mucilaginibacter sp. KACC 22063]|uniref:DUF4271 domain-containing protein n=1 Tax=Mucilaginibacter sp. KACC 22063 TaxID=3025666 RepID=UPI0023673DCB|nr:DUF4271 domain-containing protein [Mucilaginibacter sp. KACC 22063]WDF56232.1 DUF4271 domain-containing protein [Mucilaginibacter sp. KACC 22063]